MAVGGRTLWGGSTLGDLSGNFADHLSGGVIGSCAGGAGGNNCGVFRSKFFIGYLLSDMQQSKCSLLVTLVVGHGEQSGSGAAWLALVSTGGLLEHCAQSLRLIKGKSLEVLGHVGNDGIFWCHGGVRNIFVLVKNSSRHSRC